MGCKSCKEKREKRITHLKEEIKIEGKTGTFTSYVFRIFTFILSMIILPFVYPLAVWLLFKKIILQEQMSILPVLVNIGKIMKGDFKRPKKGDGDYINLSDANPDDYKLVGVDEITKA